MDGTTPRTSIDVKIAVRSLVSIVLCCWSAVTSSKPQRAKYSAIDGSGVVSHAPIVGFPAFHFAMSGFT